jgi:pyruvyltransferase
MPLRHIRNFFKRPTAKAYWWTQIANFGDALAPLLLGRFADLDNVQYAPVGEANIASVGSILEHIPAGWSGYIVGSGILREESKLKFDPQQAKILALRGPLSARGIKGSFAIGDPGLLANELVGIQEKQWDLGIVPHWLDDQLEKRFRKLVPTKFTLKVISPHNHPLKVIREIGACKRIVTSSLHGMIVADSIGGIPRRVEVCEKMKREGGTFKFHDYSASIKTPLQIGKMTEPNYNQVDDTKNEIYDAYRELGGLYGKN